MTATGTAPLASEVDAFKREDHENARQKNLKKGKEKALKASS
jgi:hypothetical protein